MAGRGGREPRGGDEVPAQFGHLQTFAASASNPVDIQIGPGGDVFYPDIDGGSVRRISYVGSTPTSCPVGNTLAQYFNNTTLAGSPSLTRCEASVNYDWGTASPAPGINVDQFSARWTGLHTFGAGSYTFTVRADDGVRVFVDGLVLIDQWRDQAPTTYTASRNLTAGDHEVKIEYYEAAGGAVAQVSWAPTTVVNTPPVPSISTPATGTTWRVGGVIQHSGTASDTQDGTLPPSAGLQLVVDGTSATTPFTRTVIIGSNNSVSAPSPQIASGTSYEFVSWSDQGAATHNITAPASAATYTATYRVPPAPIHVGDLDGSAATVNKTGWRATVSVLVHNGSEIPVIGATVTGTWSGGQSGTASCTTRSNGTCNVSTAKIATAQTSATFTVTGVTATSCSYAPATNHDPDSGSNGTTIIVTRT